MFGTQLQDSKPYNKELRGTGNTDTPQEEQNGKKKEKKNKRRREKQNNKQSAAKDKTSPNQPGTTRRRHTHTHSQRRKGGAAINWLFDHHVLRQTWLVCKSCQNQYTRRSCQWLKWLQISMARVNGSRSQPSHMLASITNGQTLGFSRHLGCTG